HIDTPDSQELLTHLYPGSSVNNPIDFLATGTAEQLGTIIDYADKHFTNIDGMVVIFGTPGLFPVFDVYDILDEKMRTCKKPIYPVLPSILTAREEVNQFIEKGYVNFPDEVNLGRALSAVYNTPVPQAPYVDQPRVDRNKMRKVIKKAGNGYLEPLQVQELLDAAGIPRAVEMVAKTTEEVSRGFKKINGPVAMKVVGPIHKSDVGGVVLNVKDEQSALEQFERMMTIKDTTAVLMQPMLEGTELFAGVKLEDNFGHMVMCGMGGIFIEVFKDVANQLSPLSQKDAFRMIYSLKSREVLEGTRGQGGVNIEGFADILVRLSALVEAVPEIYEMDLNPLLGNKEHVIAVDARIRIER
ncbi:MAG: acetate--CoA ligase family protein, partial [Bacteroidota bacterium]